MKLKQILIAILAVVLLCAAAFGIYHIPRNTKITMNAMLVNHDGSSAKMTKLTFSGKMTHYLFGEQEMKFDGDVIINAEPFSDKPETYHQEIYFVEGEKDILTGQGVYFAPNIASAQYTVDGAFSNLVIRIVGWDGGKDYYVVAPAVTWSQIDNVFSGVGVTNPFVDDQYDLMP